MSRPGALVLESGRVFRGQLFGGGDETIGEVVFNTSMTGYQEILTDPSYAGQIVVFTAPQIGNTGVNESDAEAAMLSCSGMVIRDRSRVTSSWRSEGDLDAYLKKSSRLAIEGVDTRAITRAIREGGAQRGAITAALNDIDGVVERIAGAPQMEGLDLVPQVTCKDRYEWDQGQWVPPDLESDLPPADKHVIAYDFGIKRGMLRDLRSAGFRVTVVPATTPASEVLSEKADGYFLSNGPGDPAAVDYAIEAVREIVAARVPLFGICLGHQVLALALGARTFKLPFGHHGGNHPVVDLATGKVEITSHNHGFAVHPELPVGVRCSHRNLYDNTVEGIEVDGRPIFGIQYHPEAAPGPRDAHYLFARFRAAVDAR